ncbi:MAG: NADH-quinone oxidoreductase subunit J [Alphaproteobacteria bacterium]|nr:MAG: NADH-quinone oxidoreductase subunit J [Alphaproteobacteria bacterium]
MLPTIAFYLFSGIAVGSGLMMISARNPVHSVLYLILAFFSSAGLFVLLGAEFLAMLLVVVYVGAVAVLFLFVVMMLDIDFVQLRQGMMQNLPASATVGLILLAELILAFTARNGAGETAEKVAEVAPMAEQTANTNALGQIIYTDYFFMFQTAGLILLVAMIGAIVLTLRHREGVRRQNISEQVNRDPKEAVVLTNPRPGQGL